MKINLRNIIAAVTLFILTLSLAFTGRCCRAFGVGETPARGFVHPFGNRYVNVWTINDKAEAQRFIEKGADFITTDYILGLNIFQTEKRLLRVSFLLCCFGLNLC